MRNGIGIGGGAYIKDDGGVFFEVSDIELLDEDVLGRSAIRDGRGNYVPGVNAMLTLELPPHAEPTYTETVIVRRLSSSPIIPQQAPSANGP